MTATSAIVSGATLGLYVILSVAGLAFVKAADNPVSLRFVIGGALYGAGFLIWIFAILRTLPLSIAFPLAAGALILGTQAAGWIFLKEALSPLHIVGVALIVAGIGFVYWAQWK